MENLNDIFWNTVDRYYSLKHEDEEKNNSKCVICHRNGSSVFSIVVDKNRKLKIHCDNKNPCSIEIIIPPFSLLTKELTLQYERIESLQSKIIETKNGFIFGYMTEEETVETFQQLKTDLNKSITKSEQLFQLLIEIKPDEIKIEEYKKERNELIFMYKSLIAEYKTTKSAVALEKAILIHKDITIKNNEIMKLSYIHNNVEQEDGKYKLVQKELPIDSIEMIDLELVKNVDLQQYIQNDTTVIKNKPIILEPEKEPEEPEEFEEFEEPEVKPPKKANKRKTIKIKIVPDVSPDVPMTPDVQEELEPKKF